MKSSIKRCPSCLFFITRKKSLLWLTTFLLSLFFSIESVAQTGCITGCTSNDVQIQKAYLMADLNGTPLNPNCTLGNTVNAYLYLDLVTNTPRVGVSISGKIINSQTNAEVASPAQCFSDSLKSTTEHPITTVKFTNSIAWNCGTQIQLKDILIGWGTGNTNFCTSSAAQCPATKSKCWKQGPADYIPIVTFPCFAATTVGPIDRTKCESDTAKFRVSFTAASNTNVTSVIWEYSTNGGSSWNAVPLSSPYSVSTVSLPATSGSSTLTIDPLSVGLNNNRYRASITSTSSSNITCNTSPGATLFINPNLPASVNIVASPSGAICPGTNVTFTATPGNGGSTPVYQWKKNGVDVGTNSVTFSASNLVNGDKITVVMTSNASPCLTGSPATSNEITMVVNPNLPASVTIAAAPAGAICPGTSVTFTATPVNGGSSPSYQWKKNGGNVGTNSSTYTDATLGNGDVIKVIMTSNATPCLTGSPATSNEITMVVNGISSAPAVCVVQPSLCGPAVGKVQFTPLGGGYQYSINGTNWYNCPVFINVPAGAATNIKVKNSTGCVSPAANCNTICTENSSACTNDLNAVQNSGARMSTSGYQSTEQISIGDQTKVLAYPNPYNDKVKFVVNSSVSGKGSLEVFNMLGQKVKTIYQGNIVSGLQTFELNIPRQNIGNLIYVFRTGDKKVSGKLLQMSK